MLRSILELITERSDFFIQLMREHLEISLTSIGFAIAIGLIIGIIISEYGKCSKVILGFINFIYTIPSISLLGFLIPFSGIGNRTAIIALTIYALLPMVRNTYTGLTQVDLTILEAAKGMGSTRFQMLYKIKLPLALPVIMSGIRNMVTMTIALTGIASFIGAGGLGVAIYRGITTNNTAMTLAGSLLIAFLAVSLDFILGILEIFISRKRKVGKKLKGMLLILGIVSCVLGLKSCIGYSSVDSVIRIATKPMTEQFIIGEMLQIFIEQETDFRVELTKGVGGGTSNILPALLNGEFDLYPEYTGTGWNLVLGEEGFYEEGLFEEMEAKFQRELGLTWISLLNFNNTYGLAVRDEIVKQYHLETFSDLAAISDRLVFGAEPDFFEREDGYQLLVDKYGFNFSRRVDLDIGLKYQAIAQGEIDVMNVFTTDGQLSVTNVTVLKDDLHVYPSYMAGLVARVDFIEKYPELIEVLTKLESIFCDETVSKLNYLVEVEGQDPRNVARDFLEASNLLK